MPTNRTAEYWEKLEREHAELVAMLKLCRDEFRAIESTYEVKCPAIIRHLDALLAKVS